MSPQPDFQSSWKEAASHAARSLTVTSFCIHFRCVGVFFPVLSYFFHFFSFKPTWQHERFLPLMTALQSSLLSLTETCSAEGSSTAESLCVRQNAFLRGMSLLPKVHPWVWLCVKLCRAGALCRVLGLRSLPRGSLSGRDLNPAVQLSATQLKPLIQHQSALRTA